MRPIFSASRSQIVVDRGYVYSPAAQRIQVGGKARHQRLSAPVAISAIFPDERHTAHHLDVEVTLPQCASRCLPNGGERLG